MNNYPNGPQEPYQQPPSGYPSNPNYPPQPSGPMQQPYPPQQQGYPPPGYPQMPPQQPPKKKRKKGLWIALGIIIGAVVLCGVIASNSGSKTSTTTTTSTTTNSSTNDNSSQQQVTEPPKPTPTPKPAQKFNVGVKSLNVKEVGGKYRYFFDVRDNDTKPFEGSVYISLYNDKSDTSLGGETFDTTDPIQPTYGKAVYFDINTGPKSVHGEYGITKFKYIIRINEQDVNKGEGKIVDLSPA